MSNQYYMTINIKSIYYLYSVFVFNSDINTSSVDLYITVYSILYRYTFSQIHSR